MKDKNRSKKVIDCKFGMNCRDLEYGRCNKNHYFESTKNLNQLSENVKKPQGQASDRFKKKKDQKESKKAYLDNQISKHYKTENSLRNEKILTMETAFEDLLSRSKLTIQEKPLIECVFQQWQSKSFEIINFYKLTSLLDQILKSEKEDQTEFILLADHTGLFYGEILQQFKSQSDHQRTWNNKEETLKTAKAIDSIISFYERMMTMMPSCSMKLQTEGLAKWAIHLATETADKFYPLCLSSQETERKALLLQLKPKVEYLQKIKKVNDSKYSAPKPDIKQQEMPKNSLINLKNGNLEEVEPKDNFRDICLYPLSTDFKDHTVELRKNKVDEPFKDLNQYLDIQFRLLREDFYIAIREGFLEYNNSKNKRRNRNLVFGKGQVSSLVVTKKTIGINIVVNLPNSRRFNMSKRFIYGSMVILSSSKFYDYIICIVKNFDSNEAAKTLKKGYVNVQVEVIKTPTSLGIADIDFSEINFDIVETKVYFEPYYQVLLGLQKIYSMPLADLIVKCKFISNNCPIYLSRKYEPHEMRFQPTPSLKTEIYSFIEQWVNNPKFTFDQAQANAIRHIFKTQVSLIQGPPGTGKTYVGVHLVRILLELKKRFLFDGPIFIICFTNHALDQFLEDINHFTQKIARLGGQTKTEALKQYTLPIKKERAAAKKRIKKPTAYYNLLDDKSFYLKEFNRMKTNYQSKFSYRFITNKEIFTEDESAYFTRVLLDYTQTYQIVISYIGKRGKSALKEFKAYFDMRFPSVPEFGLAILFWLELLDFDRLILQWDDYKANKKDNEQEEAYQNKLNIYLAQRALEQNTEQNQYNEDDEDIQKQISSQDNIMFMYSEPLEVPDPSIKNNSDLFTYYESILSARYNESPNIYKKIFKNDKKVRNAFKTFVNLTKSEKWILNHYFMNLRFDLLEDISKTVLELKKINEQLDAYDDEYSRNLIKDDDIIAMTTTGAAKYKNILRGIDSKIIIVEEAAEVIESHITVSLTPSTEHLVLIGDHMQLRPSTNDYFLSKHYNLDISMFERLINNGISNIRILDQRRMRPEISGLIKLLYPDLVDAKTVLGRPNIKGFPYNLFFFNHRWLELEEEDKDSKVNNKEGDFICKFVELLVKNGYGQNQITILSLYSGQLLYIKKETMKNSLIKNIRITTVDNFQGEENDIIVLSLVRSNSQKKIGFLKVSNRVNVALSRAKLGLFIFGNAECIRDAEMNVYKNDVSQSLWLKVLSYLDKNSYIDDHLKFVCTRHNINIVIKSVDDFKKCPNGGCQKVCEARLECGHSCPKICHDFYITINNRDGHADYQCVKICERPHYCGHRCDNKCYNCSLERWKCKKIIDYSHPVCNHLLKIACHRSSENPATITCLEKCARLLVCGHLCQRSCYELCNSLTSSQKIAGYIRSCDKDIEYTRQCGHKENKPCGQKPELNKCLQTCIRPHKCGHLCNNKCVDCDLEKWKCQKIIDFIHPTCKHNLKIECYKSYDKPYNILCSNSCNRLLDCGHMCQKFCYESCNKLTIAQLNGHYVSPCNLIIEYTRKCGHRENKPCGQMMEINKCEKMCIRPHKCGHACNNMCANCDMDTWKCQKMIDFIHPICNHKIRIPCYQSFEKPETIKCFEKCSRSFICGHHCTKICHEKCNETLIDQQQLGYSWPCQLIVPYIRDCEHKDKKPCGQSPQIHSKLTKCNEICDKFLDCHHQCKSDCFSCFDFSKTEKPNMHNRCTENCDKLLICDHNCQNTCTDIKFCGSCDRACLMQCVHSKCSKKCGDECTICKEPCSYECPHFKCTNKCFEICDRQPCDKNCTKNLICGHSCMGLCGEVCPKFCRICDPENEIFKSTADQDAFVQLECGHTFFYKTLDQHFASKFNPKGLKYVSCPTCNMQIRFCMRYQDKIKRTTLNINKVKTVINNEAMQMNTEVKSRLLPFFQSFTQKPLDAYHTQLLNILFEIIGISYSDVQEVNKIYFLAKFFEKYFQLIHPAFTLLSATNYSKISLLFKTLALECDNSSLMKLKLSRIIEVLIEYVRLNDIQKNHPKTFTRYMIQTHYYPDYQQTMDTCKGFIQQIEEKNGLISKEAYLAIKNFNDNLKSKSTINVSNLFALNDIMQIFSSNSALWDFCPHGFPYLLNENILYMKILKCSECQTILKENTTSKLHKSETSWFTDIKQKSDSLILSGVIDLKPTNQKQQNCYK